MIHQTHHCVLSQVEVWFDSTMQTSNNEAKPRCFQCHKAPLGSAIYPFAIGRTQRVSSWLGSAQQTTSMTFESTHPGRNMSRQRLHVGIVDFVLTAESQYSLGRSNHGGREHIEIYFMSARKLSGMSGQSTLEALNSNSAFAYGADLEPERSIHEPKLRPSAREHCQLARA
jgi:hypothetical protein